MPIDGYVEGFQRTERQEKEGAFKSILQVLVATALFGGGLFLYWQHVQNQEQVRDLAGKAKEAMLRDNPIDLANSQKYLDEALDRDGSDSYSVVSKALLNARLFAQFNIESAKTAAERFTQQAEDADLQKQERYGARALLDVKAGKYAEVETRLVALINEGGRGPSIFEALARAQMQLGKSTEARKSLRSAAESEWRNPRYNALTSELYLLDDDLTNAKNFAKKALDANPNHIFSLLLEARVAIARDEETKKAKENLADVLGRPEAEMNPALSAYAHMVQAEFYLYDRKYNKAITEAESAIGLDATLSGAYLAKGLALAHSGSADSLATLQKGFELYPFSPRNYHLAALALLEAKHADEALAVMNQWGEKVAKDANYHVAFGNLLLSKGEENTPEALKHFDDAIKDDPNAAEAYYQMARISQKAKDYEKAVDLYNKAVGIREQYAEVYEGMGWLYAQQGHFNDAIPLFAKALTYYKASHRPRKQLNELRNDVGAALKKDRKFRGYVKPWMSESKDLIR